MSWGEVFLGVIAVSTFLTSLLQIVLLVAAGRLVKRIIELTERLDRDLKPLLGHIDAIGRDAARAMSLAAAQVERADVLFGAFASRAEETMATVQTMVLTPARRAAAIVAGVRAALKVLRPNPATRRARTQAEEEDTLFV